jgi:putative hemolysin
LSSDQLTSLTIIGVLIVLHGFIALAYAALTNSRESHFRDEADAEASGGPARLHITYQLSLTLIRFAIVAVSLRLFELTRPDSSLYTANVALYIAILLPLAFVTMTLGDLVPAAIASNRADSLARWVMLPMRGLIFALAPLVEVMLGVSRLFSSLFGSGGLVNVTTEEEIMTLVDAGQKDGVIEHREKEMIYSVLQFGETIARELMVPRIDVVSLDIDTPVEEAANEIINSGHSRIPVYQEDIDNIKGLLYAKDILNVLHGDKPRPASIGELLRPAYFVPESKRADVLFKELQARKIHMAIVVDEYGGMAGIVTIEDLIEEIVGDIQDEFDIHEEAEYVKINDDEYTVDAGINLDDFNELIKVELTAEDSDTLGGYILSKLGRVPSQGEVIEEETLSVRISVVEGQRIRKVHVTRKHPATPAEDEETNPIVPMLQLPQTPQLPQTTGKV